MAAARRAGVLAGHIVSLGPSPCASPASASSSPSWPHQVFEKCGYKYSGKPEDPEVIFLKDGHVGYIIINRPHRLNACTYTAYGLIGEYLRAADKDPDVRVTIVTGVGERGFCAGSDIKDNYDAKFKKEAKGEKVRLEGMADQERKDIGWHFGKTKKPVIAAINGHANGGGAELSLCADMRIAVKDAQFGFGEVRLGWLPGGGGTQRLPRLLPKGRAMAMLITGNRIGAEEALRLGLVDWMVDSHQELLEKVQWLAEEICLSAPLAVKAIKEVVWRGLDMPMDEGLALESKFMLPLQKSQDAREGADAFAKKRKPNWKGM